MEFDYVVVASVAAFVEVASVKTSVQAFMKASVELASVELASVELASVEAFMDASVKASMKAFLEAFMDASVKASMKTSVEAFMEASTAWKLPRNLSQASTKNSDSAGGPLEAGRETFPQPQTHIYGGLILLRTGCALSMFALAALLLLLCLCSAAGSRHTDKENK